MDSIINQIVLLLVKLLHVAFWLFLVIGTFVAKTRIVLLSIMVLCSGVFYMWLSLNRCPITDIETYFGEDVLEYEDGKAKSFITIYLEKLNIHESVVEQIYHAVIMMLILVCAYRIGGTLGGTRRSS